MHITYSLLLVSWSLQQCCISHPSGRRLSSKKPIKINFIFAVFIFSSLIMEHYIAFAALSQAIWSQLSTSVFMLQIPCTLFHWNISQHIQLSMPLPQFSLSITLPFGSAIPNRNRCYSPKTKAASEPPWWVDPSFLEFGIRSLLSFSLLYVD